MAFVDAVFQSELFEADLHPSVGRDPALRREIENRILSHLGINLHADAQCVGALNSRGDR